METYMNYKIFLLIGVLFLHNNTKSDCWDIKSLNKTIDSAVKLKTSAEKRLKFSDYDLISLQEFLRTVKDLKPHYQQAITELPIMIPLMQDLITKSKELVASLDEIVPKVEAEVKRLEALLNEELFGHLQSKQ